MPGFGAYRDMVDVQQDASATGDPVPDFSGAAFYEGVPCDIKIINGDETYRGRQLEAHIAAVVEMHNLEDITPKMRLRVTGGYMTGRLLNIAYTRPLDQERGRMPKLELYCRELASV